MRGTLAPPSRGPQRTTRCVAGGPRSRYRRRVKQRFSCPVERALDALGGKWRTVLLARVKEGPSRYADLRRAIPRISEKMLSQRLRELVEAGWVRREGGAYALTPRGDSARAALDALYALGLTLEAEEAPR